MVSSPATSGKSSAANCNCEDKRGVNMNRKKNSFVFFETFYDMLKELSDSDKLKYFVYITEYGLYGNEPNLCGIEKALWVHIKYVIDLASEKYEASVNNGKKGGRPKNTQENLTKPNETQENLTKPNETNNENENENENEKRGAEAPYAATPDGEAAASLPAAPEKRAKFKKPSVDEVAEYCAERKNGIDARSFVDFYESKGWKIGANAMKDWRAAVRTWERRNRQTSPPLSRADFNASQRDAARDIVASWHTGVYGSEKKWHQA